MQTLSTGMRGIALLIELNWDRMFAAALLAAALLAGSFVVRLGLGG